MLSQVFRKCTKKIQELSQWLFIVFLKLSTNSRILLSTEGAEEIWAFIITFSHFVLMSVKSKVFLGLTFDWLVFPSMFWTQKKYCTQLKKVSPNSKDFILKWLKSVKTVALVYSGLISEFFFIKLHIVWLQPKKSH